MPCLQNNAARFIWNISLKTRQHLESQSALHFHCSHYSQWKRPIAASNELTHLKSKFQAYVTEIGSEGIPEQSKVASWMKGEVVPDFLDHLHGLEARTRRATHAMYAWRLRPPPGSSHPVSTVYVGSSNGGEAGAGERLERLLEMGKRENTLLIVFRWYGGVKLGSERWRCISTVAKEALERGQKPPDRCESAENGSSKTRRR